MHTIFNPNHSLVYFNDQIVKEMNYDCVHTWEINKVKWRNIHSNTQIKESQKQDMNHYII